MIIMNRESLFERNIRWILNDVSVLIQNECYVGAMREMCCIIDGLSGYYVGSTKDKNRNSGEEFIKFVKAYFTEFNRYAVDEKGKELTKKMKQYREAKQKQLTYYQILYSQFRCGLVHNLLMKTRNAIYRGRNNPYFCSTRHFKLIINIDHFYDDFVRAVLTYKDNVLANKNGLKDKYKKRHKFLTGQKLTDF